MSASEKGSLQSQHPSVDLGRLLSLHIKFLEKLPGGIRADLRGVSLRNLRHQGLKLRDSVCSGVDFTSAEISSSDFSASDCFATVFRTSATFFQ